MVWLSQFSHQLCFLYLRSSHNSGQSQKNRIIEPVDAWFCQRFQNSSRMFQYHQICIFVYNLGCACRATVETKFWTANESILPKEHSKLWHWDRGIALKTPWDWQPIFLDWRLNLNCCNCWASWAPATLKANQRLETGSSLSNWELHLTEQKAVPNESLKSRKAKKPDKPPEHLQPTLDHTKEFSAPSWATQNWIQSAFGSGDSQKTGPVCFWWEHWHGQPQWAKICCPQCTMESPVECKRRSTCAASIWFMIWLWASSQGCKNPVRWPVSPLHHSPIHGSTAKSCQSHRNLHGDLASVTIFCGHIGALSSVARWKRHGCCISILPPIVCLWLKVPIIHSAQHQCAWFSEKDVRHTCVVLHWVITESQKCQKCCPLWVSLHFAMTKKWISVTTQWKQSQLATTTSGQPMQKMPCDKNSIFGQQMHFSWLSEFSHAIWTDKAIHELNQTVLDGRTDPVDP